MVSMKPCATRTQIVCRAIAGILVAAVAACIIACCIGCETTTPTREQVRSDVEWALRIAYDVGGRNAVSNRIEQLVVKGKLTREQADALHYAAQRAYEKAVEDLDPDGVPTNASQGVSDASGAECDGCTPCAPGGDCGDPSASCGDCKDNDCNEDANCGECEDCKANG